MSSYPDGSKRAVHGIVDRVALPSFTDTKGIVGACIKRRDISKIVSHRIKYDGSSPVEEFLVEWRAPHDKLKPLSWHNLEELRKSLAKIQRYLSSLEPAITVTDAAPTIGLKRANTDSHSYGQLHPQFRALSPTSSLSSGVSSPNDTSQLVESRVYQGRLKIENGLIKAESLYLRDANVPPHKQVPWDDVKNSAIRVGDRLPQAKDRVRAEFSRKLSQLNATGKWPRLSIKNDIDGTVPSLDFKFVDEHQFGKGVVPMDWETIVGCGAKYPWSPQRCSPHMGQHKGCEYSRVCDCMEYAEIDTAPSRLKDTDREWMAQHPEETRLDLPKRFPYFTSGVNAGCLVPFYLDKRSPIYECNSKCDCGPDCRNKLVQHGRTVPLEIFRTSNGRGWGLRCKVDLRPGQFIDTYRGEVITGSEADLRETQHKSASYLFTLDKFAGEELDLEDCYVVDGEYVGGPTRFINHSCEPNCQQHTVSLNKHDRKVYLLAFFTNRFVPAGTELTFDYMDKDGEVEDAPNQEEDNSQPCFCGTKSCRGTLWV
ncbi:hypothetical protein FH972_022129 [Carpinus fangiana]|uniref:Histone-lysine N-methyltransferase n=1 Tax=Carpinus fangiana TaxID=176857 RepID=A0A5N6KRC4_9ROSI|nr:hypothetical protein FH972_022129 [Carpinus fangiana]